jgi:cytochrome c-type biogenesis protein CcmH
MTARVLALVAAALVATAAVAEEDAMSLITRLRAPCCWNQTLDVHASPTADGLRDEIRKRAAAGETIAAIEADVVKRYGERIRAVPTAGFLTPFGIFGLMAGVFGLILTITVGVRMTRHKNATVVNAPGAATPEAARADSAEARALRSELEALD